VHTEIWEVIYLLLCFDRYFSTLLHGISKVFRARPWLFCIERHSLDDFKTVCFGKVVWRLRLISN
jgi:hypothetical protein